MRLRVNLEAVPHTPTFKDKLALVCYPELLQNVTGKQIFNALKQSFTK